MGIAELLNIDPPTVVEMRRYHTEPEFHARVYTAAMRLRDTARPVFARIYGNRIRDMEARDRLNDRLFWLALRMVVEQEWK